MDNFKCAAIIVAAGKGKRMKSAKAKQFIEINGRTIIERTVDKFEKASIVDHIVIVSSLEGIDEIKNMVNLNKWQKVINVVEGGKERQNSVYNGLLAIKSDTDVVLIHDGVRPFIKEDEITKMAYEARDKKACVLGAKVKDTIKVCSDSGKIEETPDRSYLWAVQTPQAFDYSLIKKAYESLGESDIVTDDASVAEKYGADVFVIEGGYDNIKITTPEDLYFAKAILEKEGSK